MSVTIQETSPNGDRFVVVPALIPTCLATMLEASPHRPVTALRAEDRAVQQLALDLNGGKVGRVGGATYTVLA